MRIAQLSVLTKHCCLHQHHIISCYQTVVCGSIATVVQALNHLSGRHELDMLMCCGDWQCNFRWHGQEVVLPLVKLYCSNPSLFCGDNRKLHVVNILGAASFQRSDKKVILNDVCQLTMGAITK